MTSVQHGSVATGLRTWLRSWRARPVEARAYERIQAVDDGEVVELRGRDLDPSQSRDEEDLGREDPGYESVPQDMDTSKPFPVNPDEPKEFYQLTWRALIVGSFLGGIVGASNIYLGLKTGFTFGPQLFGAIFGYAMLKPMERMAGSNAFGRLFGGYFGPKENCTVQSAATAAGALGILFVSAVPAMYTLGLLSISPANDVGKLIALTTSSSFFGVFFVIPLRRYFIIKQKLTFPTPAATAYTIRALHNGTTGALTAARKSRALLISFLGVFCHKILSGYAPGILANWHIGWFLDRIGLTFGIGLENYGWWIQLTPAFFGAGMLSGLNASWSFFGGTVLAWGVIAPCIVYLGYAVGEQTNPDTYPELWTYTSLTFKNPERYLESPSPRYWLLWPGVLIMLVYSFTEVAFSMGAILLNSARSSVPRWSAAIAGNNSTDDDATPPEDEVPTAWWIIGLGCSTVLSSLILATMFDFSLFQALVSLVLGFLFSFIGVQSSGQTDVNPVGTIAKASQVIFGGITKQAGFPQVKAEIVNLTAGSIAAGTAGQATDMVGDLKTGYLLGAKPRNQFIAQLVGSAFAVILNVGLFVLFTKSSPCIITGAQPCAYAAPSVAAWAAVAVGVTSEHLPVPTTSGYTALFLSILAAITVVAKHLWIPQHYHPYIPNWNAIGLAFVVHQTYYSLAMVMGSVVNAYWQRRNPKSHDMYMFAISAGMLAGEGMGGVAEALLAILQLDGSHGWATSIGCPANQYCG